MDSCYYSLHSNPNQCVTCSMTIVSQYGLWCAVGVGDIRSQKSICLCRRYSHLAAAGGISAGRAGGGVLGAATSSGQQRGSSCATTGGHWEKLRPVIAGH